MCMELGQAYHTTVYCPLHAVQTCPDYRAQQCSIFNIHQPVQGKNYTWRLYDSEFMGSCEGDLVYVEWEGE